MPLARPVAWVSPVLYTAVLLAGLYAGFAGLSGGSTGGGGGGGGGGRFGLFLGALAGLFAVEVFERRRYREGTPTGPAAVLLGARVVLFVAVVAADTSRLSRALFVLVPFIAYFAFGRWVSIGLGVGCVALVVADFTLSAPGWYTDVEHVSDLLMFAVGLTLTIAMAAAAAQEQRLRVRLEQSHEQLRVYADQVAALSTAAERNRVARDIHDSLGHHLTTIAVLVENARALRDRDPAAADEALRQAHRSTRQALDDVRQSVRTLRAEAPTFRLVPALSELVRQVDGGGQPSISLQVGGDESGYDESTLTTLYRAAQEGLTNARRHAQASTVTVNLALDATSAQLVVADDGRGLRSGQKGFGLLGMRERVELAGGRVDVHSAPGTGTELTVTIPRVRPA
jgi:signal transduction histidine kinase